MQGEATRLPPRILTLLNALSGVVIIAGVLCFVFGVGRFRDGPIHPCEKDGRYLYHDHPYGYCGKQGQSHTATDFKHYREWEDIIAVLWPLTMLGMASLVWQAKQQKP